MTRIKKYVAAATVTAAVLAVPTGAYALTSGGTSSTPSASVPSVKSPGAPAASGAGARTTDRTSSIRVVAPGERVKAGPGIRVWLTREGKYWSTPDMDEQFRSVVDGNLDLSTPGVSRQSESVGDRYFHSGVYYGSRAAARVELTTATGRTVRASMVELAGKPGWGAWYATTELPSPAEVLGPEGAGTGAGAGTDTGRPADFIRSVTLYDTAGRVLATLESPGN
ncbi:hypothetical protein [Streptomyces lushanensis]|uniref:hypothetical protein n=1 Tax=Streptomyces lushanensis TaxID=1434255 RepID=UPI000ADDE847|nr:hypothetical protein [Streptomyces lushanensis]